MLPISSSSNAITNDNISLLPYLNPVRFPKHTQLIRSLGGIPTDLSCLKTIQGGGAMVKDVLLGWENVTMITSLYG